MSFIENMNADSLSMPQEEFDRYMSGEAIPHDPTRQYSCEGLRLMHQNLSSLTELRGQLECLMAEALQLQQDNVDFKENFKKEINAVLARTPLVIKPRKTKVNIDDEVDDAEVSSLLPPPLLPEVVGSGGVLNQPMIVCNNTSETAPDNVQSDTGSIPMQGTAESVDCESNNNRDHEFGDFASSEGSPDGMDAQGNNICGNAVH